MVRNEFSRFIRYLNEEGVSEGTLRIAFLICHNLHNIAQLSTYHGQRVRRIVSLAQANWDSIEMEIPSQPESPSDSTALLGKLKSLGVGPFRGFARQEIFDLDSNLVLIYGPNGTGKSSFCEALEFCLLGSVAEAENKRFRRQTDYLRNADTYRFVPPVLIVQNEEGVEVSVEPNEENYRFCFVEKNRIDSFSRIAAQTPARQTELIATLFGLETFSEFVRNFTSEIDDRYIDLVGEKAEILAEKSHVLKGAIQQTASSNEEIDKIGKDELDLAEKHREGSSYSELVFELSGDEHSKGAIHRLETALQAERVNSNETVSFCI